MFCPAHLRYFVSIAAMTFLLGCAGKPMSAFRNEHPTFEPEQYFAGRTHSWGMFETRSGAPKETLHTTTVGRWDGKILHFEQDILFESGKKEHRSWEICRAADHRYSATGTGIIGTARGEASGNVFHLQFTLDAIPGNPLGHVHMSQWMYLQKDGRMLVNRDTITKGGVIVTEITELFQKDH